MNARQDGRGLTCRWVSALVCAALLALVIAAGAKAAAAFTTVSSGKHTGQFLTAGPDGRMWMLDSESFAVSPSLVSVPLGGGKVKAYPLPARCSIDFNDLVVGADANLWYTNQCGTSYVVVRTTVRGRFTAFSIGHVAFPTGLTMGGDDRLWFTAGVGTSSLLRSISLGGRVLPSAARVRGAALASVLTSGPDGDLWVSGGYRATLGGRLRRVPGGDGSAIVAGADRSLWLTDGHAIDRLSLSGHRTRSRLTALVTWTSQRMSWH